MEFDFNCMEGHPCAYWMHAIITAILTAQILLHKVEWIWYIVYNSPPNFHLRTAASPSQTASNCPDRRSCSTAQRREYCRTFYTCWRKASRRRYYARGTRTADTGPPTWLRNRGCRWWLCLRSRGGCSGWCRQSNLSRIRNNNMKMANLKNLKSKVYFPC